MKLNRKSKLNWDSPLWMVTQIILELTEPTGTEYIFSMDGYLPRSGYYGELSSKFKFPGIQNQIFFVARYVVYVCNI